MDLTLTNGPISMNICQYLSIDDIINLYEAVQLNISPYVIKQKKN